MQILDDVQTELREPRFNGRAFPSSETNSQIFQGTCSLYDDGRRIATRHFNNIIGNPDDCQKLRLEYLRKLPPELRKFGDIVLFALGESVVGYGVGITSAMDSAQANHFNPYRCHFIMLPSLNSI